MANAHLRLAVVSLLLGFGGFASADLLIMKDGRRLEGRLGSQGKDSVTFFVKRGSLSTRMEFARSEIEEIRETPPLESAAIAVPAISNPTPVANDKVPTASEPELLLVMNRYCASRANLLRTKAAAEMSTAQGEIFEAQRAAGALGTVPALIGQRVMVSGRVADVIRDGEVYVIQMRPMKSTASAVLTDEDQRHIAEAERTVAQCREALDRLNDRDAPETLDGYDKRAWRLRMEAHQKSIAAIKRAAVERKPAHAVQVRTPDVQALSLRPGSGVHFPATISAFEMVDAGDPKMKTPAPAGANFCIHCDLVADRIGPTVTDEAVLDYSAAEADAPGL